MGIYLYRQLTHVSLERRHDFFFPEIFMYKPIAFRTSSKSTEHNEKSLGNGAR